MKYTDYYSYLILTEGWKTYKPSNNPEILLYDFYVLSYLTTLPIGPEQKGFGGNLIGRSPNEVKLDIEHAQSVLLPVLVKKLKNALFLAICAEIRHMFDNKQKYDSYKNNSLLKYYVRYYTDLSGNVPPEFAPKRDVKSPRVTPKSDSYLTSYNAAMMAIKKSGSNKSGFVELARQLFKTMKWHSSYGGDKWAEICSGYLLLDKAHTNNEKQVAIDHAYDLQHNTGTALNKVDDFKVNGSFDWIQKALDYKRDVGSMYELLPHCSSDMRKLALEAFKIASVKKPEPYDDIDNDSKDDDNESEFEIGDKVNNNNNTIVPGNIYNVSHYGCFFYVESVESSPPPYKALAKGKIHFIYDLAAFEELNAMSSKNLQLDASTAINTDYLTTEDLLSYYAKDSSGNLLKVGTDYVSPSYGVQGKLIKIYAETDSNKVHKIGLKITDIKDETIKQAFLSNLKIGDTITIYDIVENY
jgi:hypothetical protein